jgi:hypothetical protein
MYQSRRSCGVRRRWNVQCRGGARGDRRKWIGGAPRREPESRQSGLRMNHRRPKPAKSVDAGFHRQSRDERRRSLVVLLAPPRGRVTHRERRAGPTPSPVDPSREADHLEAPAAPMRRHRPSRTRQCNFRRVSAITMRTGPRARSAPPQPLGRRNPARYRRQGS